MAVGLLYYQGDKQSRIVFNEKYSKRSDMKLNQNQKKYLLYSHIGLMIFIIGYGINDHLSGKSLGGEYWAILIIFFATLAGMLHIQNKYKHKIMNDKEQIENVVQLHVDSMDESNPDKVKQAFHINAKVVGYLHGDFMEMSVGDFSGFVASQQPSPKEKGENIIFKIFSCWEWIMTKSVMVE